MPVLPRAAALSLAAALSVAGGAAAAQPAPPSVTVSAPLQRPVTDALEYTGQFAPVDYVEIRPRVSGYITEIAFQDGQIVHKGDVLVVIDPRPYEIELQQAEAQRDTAAATLEFATRDVSRGAALRQSEALAASTYDQRVQQMKTATAQLSTANAAIRQAQLDLEYAHIRAPITGRISNHQVSVGNLVLGSANSGSPTLLTTIVSVDPIWFNVDMSESDFLAYRRATKDGPQDGPGLPVQVRLDDEKAWARTGRIDFVDNQIDRTAGTIRVRATFANPGMLITPGQFGRIRMPTSPPHPALMVPDAAVTTDQSRKVVMTVAADGTVVPKVVDVGPIADGLRVVRSGLSATDQVVIEGLLRARPGAKVSPQPGQITAAQS